MAYNPLKWQDEVLEEGYENRYRETDNPDGTITHVPEKGTPVQEGTPQSARNFNHNEAGTFEAGLLGYEATRLLLQHGRDITALAGEMGAVTLTNSAKYPGNSSRKTVALKQNRNSTHYNVVVLEPQDAAGRVGRVLVTDKLINGFKIEYTGDAPQAELVYIVQGGM